MESCVTNKIVSGPWCMVCSWSADFRPAPYTHSCNLRRTFLRETSLCWFCESDHVATFLAPGRLFSYYLPFSRLYSGALLNTICFGYPFCSFRWPTAHNFELQYLLLKSVSDRSLGTEEILDPSCLAYSIFFSYYSAFYVLCSIGFSWALQFLFLMDPKFCPCRYQLSYRGVHRGGPQFGQCVQLWYHQDYAWTPTALSRHHC